MTNLLDTYQKHSDHCLALAEVVPDDRTRASLLRIARLFEVEGRLIVSARSNLSESRELLKRVAAVHSMQNAAVQVPLTVQPFRATDGQGRDT
jgi:hypothetical protein